MTMLISSKKTVPYVLLLLISFLIWLSALAIQRAHPSIMGHSPFDQHTRQAQAWLHGSASLDKAPSYLEISHFEGRSFVSFPPTPSLVELPLTFLFGSTTPSYLLLYLFAVVALFSLYDLGVKMGLRRLQAAILSLCFVFGTNVLVSVATGGAWAQGQIYGFSLALLGLRLISSRPAVAYAALALAVGCRPFYFFYLPLYFILDLHWNSRAPERALGTAAASFFHM